MAILSACGSPEHDNSVPVNLSLVVDPDQAAQQSPPVSPLMAFIDRWLIGGVAAWAQAVSEIRTIEVEVHGPDISSPPSTSVPVTNPTSGQVIPVTIQAPSGANRTITVAALNGATPPQKIYSGSAANVTLAAGTPVDLTVQLARTVIVQVNKLGTGNGTVTSSPPAIACTPPCSGRFDAGSSVSLTAAGDASSTFAGWSGGGCSGTGPCILTMPASPTNNQTITVTATFNIAANTRHLTVNKSGTGTGTVTSVPAGISCGATCGANFPVGSIVTLTAGAATGSTFTGWSGGGCSGTGTCAVVMNTDQTVVASFAAANAVPATLTVSKQGTGATAGTVTSSPGGINCGNTCSASFPTGSTVTLTATVPAGTVFAGWSGGGCSGTGTCTTVMASSQTVVATFNTAVTLTVNKTGTGNGTVTSSPAGINCGNDCSQGYAQGTVVTLTAAPNGNSTFTGWSGGGCSGTGSCIVIMNANTTVSAQFTRSG